MPYHPPDEETTAALCASREKVDAEAGKLLAAALATQRVPDAVFTDARDALISAAHTLYRQAAATNAAQT